MKKTLSIILAAVFVLALAVSFAACGKPDKTAEYTITFDSMGGSEVAGIKGKAGDEIKAPADPVKDGFEFSGWFESIDGGETLADTAFAFAYMPAKNVTVYARWTAVSEVGNKYAVKNYKTDVRFEFDDPAMSPDNLEDYQKTYSTMWVSFKENNAVEIYLHAEMPKDDTRFYAVNSENAVEFFETVEDAEKMTNKLTADYYGWNYTFDSSRKTLTVSVRMEESKMTLTMILTAVE